MAGRNPFEVIEGGKGSKPRRKAAPRASSRVFWECRACEADIGVATKTLVKIKFGPQEDERGRISGGADGWACLFCLMRGKVTHAER